MSGILKNQYTWIIIIFNFAKIAFVKKKIPLIWYSWWTGFVTGAFLIYRNELFQAYAFCTIALFTTYVFLIYTQSKIAVLSALMCHVVAIVAMYFSGSMMNLSILYILLPFIALMVRNIWMEKLAHTFKLWIEPTIFLIAVVLYIIEIRINKGIETADARIFPIAFFLANGFMIFDVLSME